MLTLLEKTLTTNVLNDGHDYLEDILFSNDDDVQTLGKFSIGFANDFFLHWTPNR